MRRFKGALIAVAAVFSCCAPAAAQDYPSRTVRVIIPLGPGGGGDIFTRAVSDNCKNASARPSSSRTAAAAG